MESYGGVSMEILYITLILLAVIAVAVLVTTLICFHMAFYSSPKGRQPKEEFPLPAGDVYLPHKERMIDFMKQTRALSCEEVSILSFDGLRLYGKYYECCPGAPIELMMSGYRGLAERDLCGGVQRSFKLNRNVLLIDQRACGKCDGTVITFGILERYDCLSWANYLYERFSKDIPVILTGVSMGAATVMMATQLSLPKNVVGVIADCGYSSPKEIICKVIQQMKLPVKPLYPFVKLAAKIFGHFDLEAASPLEAMGQCTLPVFFAHGEDDDYVPCDMTRRCFEACTGEKRLLTVPGAGHGLAYLLAPQEYVQVLKDMIPLYKNYPQEETHAKCN